LAELTDLESSEVRREGIGGRTACRARR
jgi:hypothetical protein